MGSIDASGKMIMPGFVDAHSHPIAGGLAMTGVDLQSNDIDEILARLWEYAAANPDLEIIQGYGIRFNRWNDEWPNAAMLDEIESERPILLWTIDGHGGWANCDLSGGCSQIRVVHPSLFGEAGGCETDQSRKGDPDGHPQECPK
ncbi:MAG: amidohydrolase family protein, partial [Thermoanaerobaculia bacterium]